MDKVSKRLDGPLLCTGEFKMAEEQVTMENKYNPLQKGNVLPSEKTGELLGKCT